MADGSINRRALGEALCAIDRPRIVVIGDLMVDRYVMGSVDRVSPEAPIPVLQVEGEENRLGGAGSVVCMLRALGAEVDLVSVVGDDERGAWLRTRLADLGVGTERVLTIVGRPTTQKTRMIAHDQQLLRIDREDTTPIAESLIDELVAGLQTVSAGADVVLVSDYGKGLLTPRLLAALAELRSGGVEVILDPKKGRDVEAYRGMTALTPNRLETELATGVSPKSANWQEAADLLLERLDLELVVLTLDRDGIVLAHRGGAISHFPTRPRGVYDVTGAGDMVLAMLGFARAGSLSWPEAIVAANVAAGIEVSRLGVVPVARAEVVEVLTSDELSSEQKLTTLERFVAGPLRKARERGERVVFTNGCFDLLHVGHVKLLQFARAQGDLLVVGLNSDTSVRAIKGAGRPVIGQIERAHVLAALAAVDYVMVFEEQTPLALIEALVPEVLVKAEDYMDRPVVGRSVVERAGGQVVLAPLVSGVSTTQVIDRFRETDDVAAAAARSAAEQTYHQSETASKAQRAGGGHDD